MWPQAICKQIHWSESVELYTCAWTLDKTIQITWLSCADIMSQVGSWTSMTLTVVWVGRRSYNKRELLLMYHNQPQVYCNYIIQHQHWEVQVITLVLHMSSQLSQMSGLGHCGKTTNPCNHTHQYRISPSYHYSQYDSNPGVFLTPKGSPLLVTYM